MLKIAVSVLVLILVAAAGSLAAESPITRTTFRVAGLDPVSSATIATGDKLYLKLSYESAVPVRFVAEATRQEELQEKSFISSTPPYSAGRGEALVWIGFPSAIRVDVINVTAYDMEWKQIGYMSSPIVITWSDRMVGETRQLSPWVEPLLRQHRRVFDNTFDPQPTRPDRLFDVFFLFSIMSIPCYLGMQLQLLVRYRDEWRKYATAPLVFIFPIALYSLFGIGFETAHWVIFLFRFFPVSLCYLILLWLARWVYDRRQQLETLVQ